MSEALNALLSYDVDPTKEVFIKRLGVNFKIKPLTSEEFYEIREQATYSVGKGKKEVNNNELDALLVSKGVIEPNFADKKLLEKFNVPDASHAVTKALFVGEIKKLQEEILRLSGFEDSEEEIEEVKN